MQKDKFVQASSVIQDETDETAGPSSSTSNTSMVESPVGIKKYTKQYYTQKLENSLETIQKLEDSFKSTPLEEIDGLLTIKKVKPKPKVTSNMRVTQVYGSMEGQQI